MARPFIKDARLLNSREKRQVLWGLVLRYLPEDKTVPYRCIETMVSICIECVELLDPELAAEWTYEKNTIISLLIELDGRQIVVFNRPKIALATVGKGEVDYDSATVARGPKWEKWDGGQNGGLVHTVMNRIPTSVLDLMAVAALGKP